MRVAMYYSNSDIRIQDIPRPVIGSEEILLRIEASGICGSDVMEWYRKDKVPLVLGHEVAGLVQQKGKKVTGFKVNDRIVATHHVPCLKCRYCQNGHETVCPTLRSTQFYPGGFAEYLKLPSLNVRLGTFKIPKHLSFAEATFVEPLGCVLRGQRLAGIKKNQCVLVIGSGISGLLHIKYAKYLGAKPIMAVDIDEYRLKLAKKFGAADCFKADADLTQHVKKNNKGRLADLVILCSGADSAIYQGIKATERGGTILIFSAAKKDGIFPVSINDIFWRSEIKILSSYAASPADLKEALKLISSQRIRVCDMITHRFSLYDIQKGFDLVVRPQNSVKVIIEPHRILQEEP